MHQLPWLFKEEFLSTKEAGDVVKLLHSFLRILPCLPCNKSAQEYVKELNLLKSVTFKFPNKRIDNNPYKFQSSDAQPTKLGTISRAKIAQFIFNLHNRVNQKLDKPVFGTTWRSSLKKRPKWKSHLCTFLLAVAYNYPERDVSKEIRELYRYFFSECLPNVLDRTELGISYRKHLNRSIIDEYLDNRNKFLEWTYGLRSSFGKECGSSWSLNDVKTFLNAMKAREECQEQSMGCV